MPRKIVSSDPVIEVERDETRVVKIVVSFKGGVNVAPYTNHDGFTSAEIAVADHDSRPIDEIVQGYVPDLRGAVYAILAPSIRDVTESVIENLRNVIPVQNARASMDDLNRIKAIGAFAEEADLLTESRHSGLLTYAKDTLGMTPEDVDTALGGALSGFVGTASHAQALLQAFVAGRNKK